MPHLFVAVTAHGYGHLAQVAPIIAALLQRQPDLRVTVAGTVNPDFVRQRLPPQVQLLSDAYDVALPMYGPIQVDWAAGLARYEAFEAEYPTHLARLLAQFEHDRPDLVLANVPWLPLDAAHQLGIPAVALCSLNWYDILTASPIAAQLSIALTTRLQQVYRTADVFICPAPSMPMAWLPNVRHIGPIALHRPRQRAALAAALDLDPTAIWVLMQFGGAGWLPLGAAATQLPGIHILTPDPITPSGNVRQLCTQHGALDCDSISVLAACDVLLTKPSYSNFAEAACHGIPVLYVQRDEWAETAPLIAWLAQHVPTHAITPATLAAGEIAAPLAALAPLAPVTPTAATGIADCIALLQPWLPCSA